MDEVDREVARWRYKRQLSETTLRPTTRATAPPPAYMLNPIANDKPQSDLAPGETVRYHRLANEKLGLISYSSYKVVINVICCTTS